MELEAAQLMVQKAASLYDRGESCGAEANSAKYLAAEAGFKACQQAVRTYGGMGYSKEFYVIVSNCSKQETTPTYIPLV